MLAEALDADELDSYERYLLAGGDKKKWKWSSTDKAGTVKVSSGDAESIQKELTKFSINTLKINPETIKKNNTRPDRAKEFAIITGRDWIYMNPDGAYFDKEAKQITPPFKPNTLIIKVDYEGNEI